MQSYLQSRKIGFAVKAQIERDVEKARLMTLRSIVSEPASTDDNGVEQSEPRQGPASPESVPTHGSSQLDDKEKKPDGSEEENTSDDDSSDISVAAERIPTHATVRTQYTARAALGHSLTGVHARERTTHEGKGKQVFVVGWEGPDDPLNPRNWSIAKKIGCTLQISLIAVTVGAASGIDATMLPQAAADLGVSETAESLDTGIYLIGMGLGSLVAGPFSETFGRNYVYTASMFIFMVWIMASGLVPNFGAQCAFRFLAGEHPGAFLPLCVSGLGFFVSGSIDSPTTLEKSPDYLIPVITDSRT